MTEVVAALIWRQNKFLICQRPAHKARGLLWEFVGGKVEPGETKEQALVRECREELDVAVEPREIFLELTHTYPDLTVHLTLFQTRLLGGEPRRLEHADLRSPVEALGGKSLGETLLTPTRIYVKSILALLAEVSVRGISHITGGGFYENIPRSIPDGLCAKIDRSAVRVLPIFDLIAKTGHIDERDMFNTFNMGVGMSVVVPKAEADKALAILKAQGDDAYLLGEIVAGEEKVVLC